MAFLLQTKGNKASHQLVIWSSDDQIKRDANKLQTTGFYTLKNINSQHLTGTFYCFNAFLNYDSTILIQCRPKRDCQRIKWANIS